MTLARGPAATGGSGTAPYRTRATGGNGADRALCPTRWRPLPRRATNTVPGQGWRSLSRLGLVPRHGLAGHAAGALFSPSVSPSRPGRQHALHMPVPSIGVASVVVARELTHRFITVGPTTIASEHRAGRSMGASLESHRMRVTHPPPSAFCRSGLALWEDGHASVFIPALQKEIVPSTLSRRVLDRIVPRSHLQSGAATRPSSIPSRTPSMGRAFSARTSAFSIHSFMPDGAILDLVCCNAPATRPQPSGGRSPCQPSLSPSPPFVGRFPSVAGWREWGHTTPSSAHDGS